MSEKNQCAKKVWASGTFRSYPCSVNAKFFENGKWWCHHHAPSKVAIRREKELEKYRAKSSERVRIYKMREAHKTVADIAIEYFRQNATHDELESAVNEYIRLLGDSA